MSAGIIIAGGEGRRLGRVAKSEIRLGDQPLMARVAARLEATSPLLVLTGRHDPGSLSLPAAAIAVPDLATNYQGPLAGLAAAVDWLQCHGGAETLVMSAVDTPFLPPDYATRLLAALADAPAAIAESAGQPYPTQSAWRLESLSFLPEAVRAGSAPQSPKRLAAMLGAVAVFWPAPDGRDPFFNINTPQDLEMARQRLLSEPEA